MIRFSRGERPINLAFGNALLYLPILRLFGGDGVSEFAFRLPAALFGAATVPLVYLLALRWDGRRSAALSRRAFRGPLRRPTWPCPRRPTPTPPSFSSWWPACSAPNGRAGGAAGRPG